MHLRNFETFFYENDGAQNDAQLNVQYFFHVLPVISQRKKCVDYYKMMIFIGLPSIGAVDLFDTPPCIFSTLFYIDKLSSFQFSIELHSNERNW